MVAAVTAAGAWWCAAALRHGPVRQRARALRPRVRHLPERVRAPIADALDAAGSARRPEDAFLLWAVATSAPVLLLPLLGPVLGGLGVLGLLVAGPIAVHLLRRGSARRRGPALGVWSDAVATELRSGATLPVAVDRAAAPRPLARELARLRARCVAGAGLAEACRQWAIEHPDPDTRAVVGACCVALEAGGPTAAGFAGLAAALRGRAEVRAEAVALATQARLSAVVIALAPFAFLLVGAAGDRRLLVDLVGTAAGRGCLALGLALDALGATWMHRIVRGVG